MPQAAAPQANSANGKAGLADISDGNANEASAVTTWLPSIAKDTPLARIGAGRISAASSQTHAPGPKEKKPTRMQREQATSLAHDNSMKIGTATSDRATPTSPAQRTKRLPLRSMNGNAASGATRAAIRIMMSAPFAEAPDSPAERRIATE